MQTRRPAAALLASSVVALALVGCVPPASTQPSPTPDPTSSALDACADAAGEVLGAPAALVTPADLCAIDAAAWASTRSTQPISISAEAPPSACDDVLRLLNAFLSSPEVPLPLAGFGRDDAIVPEVAVAVIDDPALAPTAVSLVDAVEAECTGVDGLDIASTDEWTTVDHVRTPGGAPVAVTTAWMEVDGVLAIVDAREGDPAALETALDAQAARLAAPGTALPWPDDCSAAEDVSDPTGLGAPSVQIRAVDLCAEDGQAWIDGTAALGLAILDAVATGDAACASIGDVPLGQIVVSTVHVGGTSSFDGVVQVFVTEPEPGFDAATMSSYAAACEGRTATGGLTTETLEGWDAADGAAWSSITLVRTPALEGWVDMPDVTLHWVEVGGWFAIVSIPDGVSDDDAALVLETQLAALQP